MALDVRQQTCNTIQREKQKGRVAYDHSAPALSDVNGIDGKIILDFALLAVNIKIHRGCKTL